MKKHEHPTNRLEKMSNFFGGGNFSKLNLYIRLFRKINSCNFRQMNRKGAEYESCYGKRKQV